MKRVTFQLQISLEPTPNEKNSLLLLAWGVDPNIDNLCKERLGLLAPHVPVSFGVLSQHGHMALHLPKKSVAVSTV